VRQGEAAPPATAAQLLLIAIGLMNTYNRMAISFRNTPQAALA
jgi:hypothetical protein